MIFATVNQLNCFLIFFSLGIIFNLIFNLIKIIFCLNFSKNIIKNIINCIFFSIFSIIFVIFINFFNFGSLSFTLILACLLGWFLFEMLVKKTVVFLQAKWYNVLNLKHKKGDIKPQNESKCKS